MTCREKLEQDNPTWTEDDIAAVIYDDCPSMYGYLHDPVNRDECDKSCFVCWNREIPEKKEEKIPTAAPNYEAMYEAAQAELRDYKIKLEEKDRENNRLIRRIAMLEGAVRMAELIFGKEDYCSCLL